MWGRTTRSISSMHFVDGPDLEKAGFMRIRPIGIGRPGYEPGDLLKLCIYGHLNLIRSSRRLEVVSPVTLETHDNGAMKNGLWVRL